MELTNHERKILAGVVARLKTDFGAERVFLFGSAARGSMDRESDIDLMAIMPVADWDTKKRVCDLCFDAELDIGRIISVRCMGKEMIENGPLRGSPLVRNVQREGVLQ